MAEEMTTAAVEAAETTVEQTEQATEPVKTFTAEEVQKMVQSEADRRVSQAVAKLTKEFDKKLSLSGLSEAERASAEKDQTIAELREQLNAAKTTSRLYEVTKEFGTRDLPISLVNMISLDGEETDIKERIDAFEKGFKDAVETAVRARLSGKGAPARGAASTQMTRDTFRKLSLMEQNKLATENPELYKQMTSKGD